MLAKAPDYGDYIALLDDGPTNVDQRKPATSEPAATGPEVYRNYLPEMYVAQDYPLGWFELTKGRHVISFVCVGKDEHSAGFNLGINAAVLERVPSTAQAPADNRPGDADAPAAPEGAVVYRGRPLAHYSGRFKEASPSERADLVRAIGSFGADAAPAIAALTAATRRRRPWHPCGGRLGALASGSRRCLSGARAGQGAQRYQPARARPRGGGAQNIGPGAAEAVPALVRVLDDPVDYVRFPAADAIGAIGPAASAAVPALIRRFQTKGEIGLVLNRVALALGAIGPLAKEALPALEQAVMTNRLGPAAREAILRIQGKAVSTWW